MAGPLRRDDFLELSSSAMPPTVCGPVNPGMRREDVHRDPQSEFREVGTTRKRLRTTPSEAIVEALEHLLEGRGSTARSHVPGLPSTEVGDEARGQGQTDV